MGHRHPIDEEYEYGEKGFFSGQRLLILIPLAAIVLVIIFCIAKVLIWDKGTRFRYDAPEDLSALDSDPMDYYCSMDPELLAGRDDKETQILFLGDDILTYGSQESSIPVRTAAATGATVYNCAFPGSSFASRYETFNEEYCTDVFSFVRIAYCIKSGDFTLLDAYKTEADIYDPSFDTAVTQLQMIDFNQIDMIFLGYGTHDYLNGYATAAADNQKSVTSMTGALYTGIDVIHEAYPHIRFIVLAPTFCFYDEGNGTLSPGDVRRVGASDENLGGYVVALHAMCELAGSSFLDTYFGIPLSAENAQEYLVDNIHVNDEVRRLIADRVIDFIENKLKIYS
ncbi:MAG: SGNH/GDSL hydrolase family protein [bacterium]|nr:SGNH/GDSL hydrolase family protein [bacterium]